MSRVAKKPIDLGTVNADIVDQQLTVKGGKGELTLAVHPLVEIVKEDNVLRMRPKLDTRESIALAGTMRALANNLVKGVSDGFEKKLLLVGVGYRAQLEGSQVLNLNLGFSHPIKYPLPEGIKATISDSQTEIVISGADKQRVGQVAAEVRAYRPVEPYKGKGIRYADETVILKETKK